MSYSLRVSVRLASLCLFLFSRYSSAIDPRLAEVDDWLYVLQHPSGAMPEDLAVTEFDLVVMDYSAEGTEETEFSKSQIEALKSTGKVILSYFSIGEAEVQRFYWNDSWTIGTTLTPQAPDWLGPSNPEFPNNFKVRFWDPDWQALLFGTMDGPSKSYLDRIIDQGFDGIYLDIIDGFEYWSEDIPERTRNQARQDMVGLVGALAVHARDTRGAPGFLVFPQNGAALIVDDEDNLDALGIDLLSIVDGIGAEDTFYDEISPQPIDEVEYVTRLLDFFRSGGGDTRLVLGVDYVWDPAAVNQPANIQRYNDFGQRSLARDYTPYAAIRDRELDSILEVQEGAGITLAQPRGDTFGQTPTLTATPSSMATVTPTVTPTSTNTSAPTPILDTDQDGQIDWEDLLFFLENWRGAVD